MQLTANVISKLHITSSLWVEPSVIDSLRQKHGDIRELCTYLLWCTLWYIVPFAVLWYGSVQVDFTHYGDVIMDAIASQITSLTIDYSIVYSDADQRKHHNSPSLAFGRGIRRRPVHSPHKWPVTRKKCPFDDVIMYVSNVDGAVPGQSCSCHSISKIYM